VEFYKSASTFGSHSREKSKPRYDHTWSPWGAWQFRPDRGGAYTDGTGRETCRRRVDWRPLRLQLGRHGYLHSKETVDGLGGGDGIFPRNARLGAAASSTGGKERGRAFASITGTRWASSAARRVDLL